jgi:hypothetical protein
MTQSGHATCGGEPNARLASAHFRLIQRRSIMSLSALAEIGSFISGVAILSSLIFLYFQLRQINHQVKQAEKNQRSAIRQG